MVYFFDSFDLDFVNCMELLIVSVLFIATITLMLDGEGKMKSRYSRYWRVVSFGLSIFLLSLILQLVGDICSFTMNVYIGTDQVDITSAIITILFVVGALVAILPICISKLKDRLALNKLKKQAEQKNQTER